MAPARLNSTAVWSAAMMFCTDVHHLKRCSIVLRLPDNSLTNSCIRLAKSSPSRTFSSSLMSLSLHNILLRTSGCLSILGIGTD
jgi:hypothetical protein